MDKAKAEAELINANANKAFQEAQAEYYKAKAAAEQASADKVQFELQKAKEQYALEIEKIKLQAEYELAQLKESMNQQQQNVADNAYYRINSLYNRYNSELLDLTNMKSDLVSQQASVAYLEAGVVWEDAFIKSQLKSYEDQIKRYEAQLVVLKDEKYAGLDNEELLAQAQAKDKEWQLAKSAFAKDPSCEALLKANKAFVAAGDKMNEMQEAVQELSWNYNILTYESSISESGYLYRTVTYIINVDFNNSYYYFNGYEGLRINESNKLNQDRAYAAEVTRTANDLGTSADTKDKNTAYGRLALANDNLKTAKAMPETTDAEKDAKKTAIENAENEVANCTDRLAEYKKYNEDAIAAEKEYKDAIAAVDLTAYNDDVTAYKAAKEAWEKAEEAWEKAKESVVALENEKDALYDYANSGTDVNNQILSLEEDIAQTKMWIEDWKTNSNEQNLANAKESIARLEAKIEAKTKIVETAKAALDAALAE